MGYWVAVCLCGRGKLQSIHLARVSDRGGEKEGCTGRKERERVFHVFEMEATPVNVWEVFSSSSSSSFCISEPQKAVQADSVFAVPTGMDWSARARLKTHQNECLGELFSQRERERERERVRAKALIPSFLSRLVCIGKATAHNVSIFMCTCLCLSGSFAPLKCASVDVRVLV